MSRGYVREGRRTSRAAGIFGVWLAPGHVWEGLAAPGSVHRPGGHGAGLPRRCLCGRCSAPVVAAADVASRASPSPAAVVRAAAG